MSKGVCIKEWRCYDTYEIGNIALVGQWLDFSHAFNNYVRTFKSTIGAGEVQLNSLDNGIVFLLNVNSLAPLWLENSCVHVPRPSSKCVTQEKNSEEISQFPQHVSGAICNYKYIYYVIDIILLLVMTLIFVHLARL